MGFTDFLKSLFGDKSQRDIKKLEPIVAQVNAIMPTTDSARFCAIKPVAQKVLRGKKAHYRGDWEFYLVNSLVIDIQQHCRV